MAPLEAAVAAKDAQEIEPVDEDVGKGTEEAGDEDEDEDKEDEEVEDDWDWDWDCGINVKKKIT